MNAIIRVTIGGRRGVLGISRPSGRCEGGGVMSVLSRRVKRCFWLMPIRAGLAEAACERSEQWRRGASPAPTPEQQKRRVVPHQRGVDPPKRSLANHHHLLEPASTRQKGKRPGPFTQRPYSITFVVLAIFKAASYGRSLSPKMV